MPNLVTTPTMTKKISLVLLILATTFLKSCFVGAGTHGSLKGYQYQITKDKLDSAVMYVIKNNPSIHRDTIGNKILADVANGKKDTIVDNSWNDGREYVSIQIKTQRGNCAYTFRYYGGKEYWDTAKTSEIFICWAYDEFGKGGSEGDGGVDDKTLKYLTEIFEKEFVNRVDNKLNLTHIETE
jgi:hypothetical protein